MLVMRPRMALKPKKDIKNLKAGRKLKVKKQNIKIRKVRKRPKALKKKLMAKKRRPKKKKKRR